MCVLQMQFLVSRLASPTLVDFDEDGRNDALSVNDQMTSAQLLCTGVLPSVGPHQQQQQQQDHAESNVADCSLTARWQQYTPNAGALRHTSVLQPPQGDDQKPNVASLSTVAHPPDLMSQQTDYAETCRQSSVPSARVEQRVDCTARQFVTADTSCDQTSIGVKSQHGAVKSCCATVSSDTESTLSLNELLDACCCRSAADDAGASESCAAFESGCETDTCSSLPPPTVSHLCEIVNILHISVDPNATHSDGILPVSENGPTSQGLNASRPRTVVCNGDELAASSDSTSVMRTDSAAISSAQMQRSFAESNLSSLSLSSCLLYTSPSPRDRTRSRMPSSA